MDSYPERRRYYPGEENVSLSEAVREAITAYETSSLSAAELDLYDHIDPVAIDRLFRDIAGIDVSVHIRLTNTIVSIWSNDGVDIRIIGKPG